MAERTTLKYIPAHNTFRFSPDGPPHFVVYHGTVSGNTWVRLESDETGVSRPIESNTEVYPIDYQQSPTDSKDQ